MIERRSLNGHKLSTKVSSDTVELSNPAVDHFAKKIQTAWQKAVSSILETGRLLIQAKQELAYGEFLLMIEERLPFGARTAQMLMRIAEHPVLSNTKFISHLPPSWGTLHRLTQLPEKALECLLVEGKITCETRSADVEEIAKKLKREGYGDLRRGLNMMISFMRRWPEELPAAVVSRLFDKDEDEARVDGCELSLLPQWIEKICAAYARQLDAEDNAWRQRWRRNRAWRAKAGKLKTKAFSKARGLPHYAAQKAAQLEAERPQAQAVRGGKAAAQSERHIVNQRRARRAR